MRRQFEGGDNKASICEASGDYLSAATIRGRRLIEEIRYLCSVDYSHSKNITMYANLIYSTPYINFNII